MEGMKATIHIFEKNINYAKNRDYFWKNQLETNK